MIRWHAKYFISFLLLTGIEVGIALFVHDRFIRPYAGDILAVIVLYLLIKSFYGGKSRMLPAVIFAFAVLVEISQGLGIGHYLGWEDNAFLRILCGSVFDLQDILCYGIGCLIILGLEKGIRKTD